MALKLSVSSYETDVNVENNSSYVQVDVTATSSGLTYNLLGSAYIEGSVGSLAIPKTYYTLGQNSSKKVYSGKIGPFTHNLDGSLASQNVHVYSWIAESTTATSDTICSMSTIPRASKFTMSVYEPIVGNTITVYTNRVSTNFTHRFSYKPPNSESYYWLWGTESESTGITVSKDWTVPVSFLNYFPNSFNAIFQIRCDTYNGSTYIGTEYTNIQVNARTSDYPTYALSISEANQEVINSKVGLYIQNKSSLKINLTNIGLVYNSPLESCHIVISDSGGQTVWSSIQQLNNSKDTSLSFSTPTLTRIGNFNVYVTLYDRRRASGTQRKTASYTSTAYTTPIISSVSVARSNSSGAESSSGTYLKYTFIANITALNNKNTKKFEIGYKQKGSYGDYTYKEITSSSYSLSNTDVVLSGVTLSADHIYDIAFKATDAFGSTIIERTLGADFKLINFNASGKSMAFGTISDRSSNETYLDSNLTINCLNGLEINGISLLDAIYPVGSIYMSVNNINPNTFIGGTWERWGNGRVPVGVDTTQGEFDKVEFVGGEKYHTLTIDEIPSHSHYGLRWGSPAGMPFVYTYVPGGTEVFDLGSNVNPTNANYESTNHLVTELAGGSQGHSILQPYITCYMWKRIK